jgi:hypothetical protein
MSHFKIAGVSFALAVVLSACTVPYYVSSDLKLPPMALTFQKRGQWGHTDYEQRKEDMIECGIPRERYEDDIRYFQNVRTKEGETGKQYSVRRKKFVQCMEDKDYQWLGLEECGPVKENRGICK